MKARSIASLKKMVLLLPILLVCGCGGGGGGTGSQPDAIEILLRDGLRFFLEPDGTASPMGNAMHFWFSVTNEGLKTRTLELRPRGDESGGRTCLGTISYDDGSGNHPVVYELSRSDAISVEIGPEDPGCLLQFDWDQIRQDNGEAAVPGYYDLTIVLDNLYVDGKKPADWPTFEVRGERRRVRFLAPTDPWDDPREVLRSEGLIVSLGTDKTVYQKGEPIPIWFHVRNEGTQTRTLETRPLVLDASLAPSELRLPNTIRTSRGGGMDTYAAAFMYYTPDGHDYVGAWGFVSDETVTKQIAPGETIRFVESVWNQVNWDGTPAQPGYYDAMLRIDNLYVDGRKLRNWLDFQVDVSATIRIAE